jgi:hypothetical protein
VSGIVGYALFAAGALICSANVYVSFFRYPLHRLLGWEYKWVSGIPVFGSLLVASALPLFHESTLLFRGGAALAVLDTGGLHWFAASMLWMLVFRPDML